jgi:hypothetical protein
MGQVQETYVAEITVVDDGTVQPGSVGDNDLVSLVRNHARGTPVLGVDCKGHGSVMTHTSAPRTRTVAVEILDDHREGLLRLLVQVGDGDASSQDGIVLVAIGRMSSRVYGRETRG